MNEEQLKKYIFEKSEYFNMKKICELAGINYQTYRGWKNQDRYFSVEKMESLRKAMIKVVEE